MKRLPRQIKRHLNPLVGQAYENELSRIAFAKANMDKDDVDDH